MNDFSMTRQFVKKPNVSHVTVDNETIVMEPTAPACFSLNAVGAVIWSLFEIGPVSLGEIIESLHNAYGVKKEQCAYDALKFIECMIAFDILVCFDGGANPLHPHSTGGIYASLA